MTRSGGDDENRDGGTGSTGGWPDGAGDYLYQLGAFYRDLGASVRAAAFGWAEVDSDARAAFLDELAKVREQEQRAWETYFARPMKGTP